MQAGQSPAGRRPPPAGHNVIILTAGLAGSSVIAGLLADAGYWAGADTVRKPDYDTFENRDLVGLNDRLLREAGYQERFDRVFRREHIGGVTERLAGVAPEPYRHFVDACNRHAPWVWKDPRLWLTIRFWARLLDRERLRIILVSRQHGQAWVSHLLRRQIETPRYCRDYLDGVRASFLEFIAENRLPYLEMVYEELLLEPEPALERLGNFLGTRFSLADLERIHRGPLYRRRHGMADYICAMLVYLKNYAERSR